MGGTSAGPTDVLPRPRARQCRAGRSPTECSALRGGRRQLGWERAPWGTPRQGRGGPARQVWGLGPPWPGVILVSPHLARKPELRGTSPQQPVIPRVRVWLQKDRGGQRLPGSLLGGPTRWGLGWDVLVRIPSRPVDCSREAGDACGVHDGGGVERVVYTSLAVSLKPYKQAINQGRAQLTLAKTPEDGGGALRLCLEVWRLQLSPGPSRSPTMSPTVVPSQQPCTFHGFSPLVLALGPF